MINFRSVKNGRPVAIASRTVGRSKCLVVIISIASRDSHITHIFVYVDSFMQQNCPLACHKATYKPPETSTTHDIDDFYQLSATDAKGKVLSMENFEGYVTVIVNVARLCDYTELFYNTLEHMHGIYPYALEILAFPFNSPNANIDACIRQIETDEKAEHKIRIMKPMDGPDSHPVFDFLKGAFNVKALDSGFATYFFINPDGNNIEMHYGTSYNALKRFVDYHVKEDL